METEAIRQEYLSRTAGLVSSSIREKTVLAVGCGAGSYMLEKLARAASPAEMRLVDFDRVEWSNICRTTFAVPDIGMLKSDALAARITASNPFVRAVPQPFDICALTEAEQGDLCEGVDLIIAGTDFFPAQALINRWSQQHRIPAVFIGIHAGAQGGRVIWSVPGQTPCYRCIAAERYQQAMRGEEETLNLAGAHGLLPDIQIIDMVALKICMALLDCGQPSAMGRFCTQMNGRNEVIVRTSPEYEFGGLLWDAVLSDLPTTPRPFAQEIKEQALFAMDTLWLRTEKNPFCPDCACCRESSDTPLRQT